MTEFSGEGILEFKRPFSKELGKAVNELRRPLRDLTKKAEQSRGKASSRRPLRLLAQFISQNREKLLSTVKLVKKQALKNEDFAKQVLRETLIQESHIPVQAAEVVSESLVDLASTTKKDKAKGLFNQTLEATTLSEKERENIVNFVEETGRELVPVEPVIEAEYEVVEEETPPEEAEYIPPGGPPREPPRRRRGFGRGGDRQRTARGALRRRGRLPWAAGIFGAAVLGLSLITGQGKPWEGYPIQWGFDVAGLAGGGAKELSIKASGIEMQSERDKRIISGQIRDMFEGSHPANTYLAYFLSVRGDEETTPGFKDKDVVADPDKYNSRMRLIMEILGEEIQSRNIRPNQIAEALIRVGQPERPSEFWGSIYRKFITDEPLSGSELAEIRSWYESDTGRKWVR